MHSPGGGFHGVLGNPGEALLRTPQRFLRGPGGGLDISERLAGAVEAAAELRLELSRKSIDLRARRLLDHADLLRPCGHGILGAARHLLAGGFDRGGGAGFDILPGGLSEQIELGKLLAEAFLGGLQLEQRLVQAVILLVEILAQSAELEIDFAGGVSELRGLVVNALFGDLELQECPLRPLVLLIQSVAQGVEFGFRLHGGFGERLAHPGDTRSHFLLHQRGIALLDAKWLRQPPPSSDRSICPRHSFRRTANSDSKRSLRKIIMISSGDPVKYKLRQTRRRECTTALPRRRFSYAARPKIFSIFSI